MKAISDHAGRDEWVAHCEAHPLHPAVCPCRETERRGNVQRSLDVGQVIVRKSCGRRSREGKLGCFPDRQLRGLFSEISHGWRRWLKCRQKGHAGLALQQLRARLGETVWWIERWQN